MKRVIGVVTGARSEYGLLRPVLRRLQADRSVELRLYVTGGHLSARFGLTIREIEKDGFRVAERVPIIRGAVYRPEQAASAFARGVEGFSRVFARRRPDLLVLMSDRYEMLAAAAAAMFHHLPVAHLSGGKTTQGSADEYVRHAVTKMSHFHFVHSEENRRRLIRMGEQPSRVFVTGALVLDEAEVAPPPPGLEDALVILFHPTLDRRDRISEVLKAAARFPGRKVALYPGADAGSGEVIEALRRSGGTVVKHLPRPQFLGLLRSARALVGNSSAGVTDTPTLGLPVVNVGDRQKGMKRAANVIDCPCRADAIGAALRKALSPAFRKRLRGLENPYGDGKAGERIVRRLKTIPLGPAVLKKVFHDA